MKHLIGNLPLERERLLDMWIEVADALDAAHAQGIVQAFQVVQLPNQEREQGMVVGLKTDFLVDPQLSPTIRRVGEQDRATAVTRF